MTIRSRGAHLAIESVSKTYGTSRALDNVSLMVQPGEILALLGPSGCGKTTLLKVIAGLIEPDGGAVLVDGRDMVKLPTHKRDMGMLFQNYALFPHLEVRSNVAFGLEMRKRPQAEIVERTKKALERVQLGQFASRMPRELSGGQQQRVALARAIAYEPAILLLDEPLAALDKNLREGMQMELRALCRQLELTAVLVTHDQEEAMIMADRIAVMRQGQIEQLDTAREVYERPCNRFVAGFIGTSNFFSFTPRGIAVDGHEGTGEDGVLLSATPGVPGSPDEPLVVAVRPEHIILSVQPPSSTHNKVAGSLTQIVFRGGSVTAVLKTASGREIVCSVPSGTLPEGLSEDAAAWASWRTEHALIINDN